MTSVQPGQGLTEGVVRLSATAGLRRKGNGTLLIGGSPLRIIRLSPAGARTVTRWCRGEPVGAGKAAQALSLRLVDAGMLHVKLDDAVPNSAVTNRSGLDEGLPTLTVVIPVKDDAEGLTRTLGQLASLPVIVVDDGSSTPVRLDPDGPGQHRLERRGTAGGPAAARNAGLALVRTPSVAFVDAGVEIAACDLQLLAAALSDETVSAIAPRVVSMPETPTRPPALARYEVARSPLDLGQVAGPVGPGRQVSYVPSACLVARTEAIRRAGHFDEAMRFGEDVDLIWRLTGHGSVRYEPTIVARHPPRSSLAGFVRQRVGYGSAAAPLGIRHGASVAPVRTSWWSLAVAWLMAIGHPVLGVAVGAGTAVALVRKLPAMPDPGVEAVLLTARGHGWSIRSLAHTAVRTWWPLTVLGLTHRSSRRVAAVSAILGVGQRLLDRPPEPALDVTLGLLDDVSYGTGVWIGAWRARTLRSLLPDIATWPPKG